MRRTPFRKQIITNYDVSLGDEDFSLDVDLSSYDKVSIEFECTGLAGVLNAELQLQQKNHSGATLWKDIIGLVHVLAAATESDVLQDDEWGGYLLNCNLTVNGCTGGTINAWLLAK